MGAGWSVGGEWCALMTDSQDKQCNKTMSNNKNRSGEGMVALSG